MEEEGVKVKDPRVDTPMSHANIHSDAKENATSHIIPTVASMRILTPGDAYHRQRKTKKKNTFEHYNSGRNTRKKGNTIKNRGGGYRMNKLTPADVTKVIAAAQSVNQVVGIILSKIHDSNQGNMCHNSPAVIGTSRPGLQVTGHKLAKRFCVLLDGFLHKTEHGIIIGDYLRRE